MRFRIVHPYPRVNGPAQALMGAAFIRYPASDKKVFLAVYEAMSWRHLGGWLAVENREGYGESAARFAKFEPRCRVIGTHQYTTDYPGNRVWLKTLRGQMPRSCFVRYQRSRQLAAADFGPDGWGRGFAVRV